MLIDIMPYAIPPSMPTTSQYPIAGCCHGRVAGVAMITMPLISPDTRRSGSKCSVVLITLMPMPPLYTYFRRVTTRRRYDDFLHYFRMMFAIATPPSRFRCFQPPAIFSSLMLFFRRLHADYFFFFFFDCWVEQWGFRYFFSLLLFAACFSLYCRDSSLILSFDTFIIFCLLMPCFTMPPRVDDAADALSPLRYRHAARCCRYTPLRCCHAAARVAADILLRYALDTLMLTLITIAMLIC